MKFLLPLTCVAAAIGIAAPAHADVNNDQDFLTQLRNADITYKDPDGKEAAKTIKGADLIMPVKLTVVSGIATFPVIVTSPGLA